MHLSIPHEKPLRALCVLIACASLTAAMAQPAISGATIPESGSLPVFPVESDLHLPPNYALPGSVDISRWFPPPGDQRRQASCTTWALCYGAMGYGLNRSAGRTYTPLDTADPVTTYSPAFIFNLLKQRGGDPCTDPSNFEDVVALADSNGCCTWEELPYDTTLSACQDPLPMRTAQTTAYDRPPKVLDIDPANKRQWQYHLDQKRPIIAEITIDSLFIYGGYATHGESMLHWHYTGPVSYLGGHAVVCTGYENDSTFTFINSFGKEWGGHGYFTATWDMIERRCYGAHVLMDDPILLTDLLPLLPAGTKNFNGPVVKKRIKPGAYFVVNRAPVQLAALRPDRELAVVRIYGSEDNTVRHTMYLRPGRSCSIYGNGIRTDYRYSKPWFLGGWFKWPIRLTVTTTNTAGDPYLARRDALLRRLHAGMR